MEPNKANEGFHPLRSKHFFSCKCCRISRCLPNQVAQTQRQVPSRRVYSCWPWTCRPQSTESSGNLRRICEEEKCTTCQSRVKHVHTCSTENFFSDDDTERDSQRSLPQRTRAGASKGKGTLSRGTLVDLMVPNQCKCHLNDSSHSKGEEPDRYEEKSPIDHVRKDA